MVGIVLGWFYTMDVLSWLQLLISPSESMPLTSNPPAEIWQITKYDTEIIYDDDGGGGDDDFHGTLNTLAIYVTVNLCNSDFTKSLITQIHCNIYTVKPT